MAKASVKRFLVYGTMTVVAIWFNWVAGNRGLFSFDQSFVLDAAYRIIHGQVIYTDFYAPFGLIAFYYTSFFLNVFGVAWSSYVLAACSLNAIMALMQMGLLEASGEQRLLRLFIGGLIASLGTVSVFGTVYPEYLACAFGLISVLALLPPEGQRRRALRLVGAAVFLALAYHSKQNVAIGFVPLLCAEALLFNDGVLTNEGNFKSPIRDVLIFLVLSLVAISIPPLLFYVKGSGAAYLHYAISLPSALGRERIINETPTLAVVALLIICGAVSTVFTYLRESDGISIVERRSTVRQILLVFHALFFSAFLEVTMVQDPFVRHMHLPLLLMLLPNLFSKLLQRSGVQLPQSLRALCFGMLCIGAFILCGAQSMLRLGQESVRLAEFGPAIDDPFYDSLRWGLPTYTDDETKESVSENELVEVVRLLREHTGSVFIYPDFSTLYAASGHIAPHPFLWFHPGLTYRDSAEADMLLLEGIKKHQCSLLVLEKSFFNLRRDRSLALFQGLKEYIDTEFIQTESIGIFTVYMRKDLEVIHTDD